MFERIKHMLIKEFIQVFRDPKMRGIIFVMPVLQVLVFGYAVTLDVKNIATGVYDLDNTVASRELVARFEKSGYFDIIEYIDSAERARALLDRGEASAVLQMNRGFGDALRAEHDRDARLRCGRSDRRPRLLEERTVRRRHLPARRAVARHVGLREAHDRGALRAGLGDRAHAACDGFIRRRGERQVRERYAYDRHRFEPVGCARDARLGRNPDACIDLHIPSIMTVRLAPAKPLEGAGAAKTGRAYVAWARDARRCRKRAGADEGARGQ